MGKASLFIMAVLTVLIAVGLRWRVERTTATRPPAAKAPRPGWVAAQKLKVNRWISAAALAAVTTLLVLGGIVIERAGRLVPVKPLQFVGDASYSVYLVHMFVVGATVAVVQRLLGHDMSMASYLILVATGIVGGLAVGGATHVFVELPLLVLSGNRRPRPSTSTNAAAGPAPRGRRAAGSCPR